MFPFSSIKFMREIILWETLTHMLITWFLLFIFIQRWLKFLLPVSLLAIYSSACNSPWNPAAWIVCRFCNHMSTWKETLFIQVWDSKRLASLFEYPVFLNFHSLKSAKPIFNLESILAANKHGFRASNLGLYFSSL